MTFMDEVHWWLSWKTFMDDWTLLFISYFYILMTDRLTLVLVKSLSRLKILLNQFCKNLWRRPWICMKVAVKFMKQLLAGLVGSQFLPFIMLENTMAQSSSWTLLLFALFSPHVQINFRELLQVLEHIKCYPQLVPVQAGYLIGEDVPDQEGGGQTCPRHKFKN